MTSEVLLMNLQAVALGADSARSTYRPVGDRVSVNNVDKIYVINEAGPVAVMTYNVASFAGLPWKTILDEFSKQCGITPLKFDDYSHQLTTFLSNIYENKSLPVSNEMEIGDFYYYVDYFVKGFIDQLLWVGWEDDHPLTKQYIDMALSQYAADILIDVPAHTSPDGQEIPESLRSVIVKDTSRIESFVADHIEYAFEQVADNFFRKTQFPEDRIKILMTLCIKSVCVDWLPDGFRGCTGVILTGFGAESVTPMAEHLKIFGTFGGVLKYVRLNKISPHPDDRRVIVETYAQADLTEAFLNGAAPDFRDTTEMAMHVLMKSVISSVRTRIYNENKKLSADIFKILQSLTRPLPLQAIDIAVFRHRRDVDNRLEPLLGAANDRVLGDYAAKLMQLPIAESGILKNDTVGGPISVLTLSKGRASLYIDGVKQ